MTIPIKIGAVVCTLGSVATAGYLGNVYLFGGTPIRDLVAKEYQYILLNPEGDADKTHWDTNWESYKQANSSKEKDIFQLTGWTAGTTQNLVEKLKEKCKELFSSKVTNNKDALYENVTTYCGRSVTIADEVAKLNLRIVSVADDSGNDGTIWTKRAGAKNDLQAELSKLELNLDSASDSTIKEKCKNVVSKNKKDPKYTEIFNAYVKVCTKQEGEQ